MALLLALGLLLGACRAEEKKATLEPYKIGHTADMTSPVSATYAGMSEAFRNYFSRLNERGGINGHPVQVAADDNRSSPERAIAAPKRSADAGDLLVVNQSLSATFLGSIAEAERAGMPWLSGGVCPPEVFPPQDEAHGLLHRVSGAQSDRRPCADGPPPDQG